MGSSDLGILLTIVIMVLLFGLLGWFFIDEDNLNSVDIRKLEEGDVPYWVTITNDTEEVLQETNQDEGNTTGFVLGALFMFITAALAAVTFGTSLAVTIPLVGAFGYASYTTLTSLPGGKEALSNIPVISQIVGAIEWLQSAMITFWRLLIFDIPILQGYSWVALLITIPVTTVGLYIILKFVRGN